MIRPVALLVAAISMSRPSIPKAEATRYAQVLNEQAQSHDFDPLTAVAIIHYETHWLPTLVSSDGEDYGLGQVRARFMSACRDDADPLHDPSAACRAAKTSLLDGATNIRRMATIISANRDLCRDKTGSAKAFQWLAGYQGRNRPARDLWCQPGETTWRVLAYREELIAKLVPKPKIHAVASRAPVAGAAPALRSRRAPAARRSHVSR